LAVLLDTAVFAPDERARAWSDAVSRLFFPASLRTLTSEPYDARAVLHQIGPIGVFRIRADPSVISRTAEAVAAGDPRVLAIALALRGRLVVTQGERTATFGPDEMSSWQTSAPMTVHAPEPFDLVVVAIPRTLLGPSAERLCRGTARRIATTDSTGAIAAGLLRSLWRELDGARVFAGREALAESVVCMAQALFADVAVQEPARSPLGRALVPAIKAHIERNVGDPHLGPQEIACAHAISTRYLHKLFAGEERTLCQWILHRRLERARRDLVDPELHGEPIMEIAHRYGVTNAAYFSRVFRAAYGCTPTQLRDAYATRGPAVDAGAQPATAAGSGTVAMSRSGPRKEMLAGNAGR
jgi:AraC-like DNA-binding protein